MTETTEYIGDTSVDQPGPGRLRGGSVAWRDLVPMSRRETIRELLLPAPWLVGSLACYHLGWTPLGALASFFLFLTGLRVSHNAQHRAIGLTPVGHDLVLFMLSVVMLASMHAIQTTHMHHHRHCLDDDDIEAGHCDQPWWRVILAGPLFPIRLHAAAWRLAAARQRAWMVAELAAVAGIITTVLTVASASALAWHVAAMIAGQCMTAFFAVWIVHRGCDKHDIARTQRGRLRNLVSYSMFYHLEHHLFPAVPTCHLPELARRVDAAYDGTLRNVV